MAETPIAETNVSSHVADKGAAFRQLADQHLDAGASRGGYPDRPEGGPQQQESPDRTIQAHELRVVL